MAPPTDSDLLARGVHLLDTSAMSNDQLAVWLRMAFRQPLHNDPASAWKTQPIVYVLGLCHLKAYAAKFHGVCSIGNCCRTYLPRKRKADGTPAGESPATKIYNHMKAEHRGEWASCQYNGQQQDEIVRYLFSTIGEADFTDTQWAAMSLARLIYEIQRYNCTVFEQYSAVGRVIVR